MFLGIQGMKVYPSQLPLQMDMGSLKKKKTFRNRKHMCKKNWCLMKLIKLIFDSKANMKKKLLYHIYNAKNKQKKPQ